MGLGLGGMQSGGASIATIVAALTGQDVVAKSFTATAATGTDAFAVATNGARIHFGAGASDYASSDGTTVTFAGPVSVIGALGVTGVISAGNTIASTSTSANFNIRSAADNATVSPTVPSTTVIPVNAFTDGDAIFGVRASTGTDILTVFQGGGVIVNGDPTSPVFAALTVVSQDTQPTGPNVVGAMYVTTAGTLKICTVAGSPGTWISVGAQT